MRSSISLVDRDSSRFPRHFIWLHFSFLNKLKRPNSVGRMVQSCVRQTIKVRFAVHSPLNQYNFEWFRSEWSWGETGKGAWGDKVRTTSRTAMLKWENREMPKEVKIVEFSVALANPSTPPFIEMNKGNLNMRVSRENVLLRVRTRLRSMYARYSTTH